MATVGESSSTPPKFIDEKPVVVRVKRKANQSRLDAFWLEINERPSKRPLLDFEKLSIGGESSSSPTKVEELRTKKVFVQHIETVNHSKATIDPSSGDVVEGIAKNREQKQTFRNDSKQEQLLSKARKNQEILAQNARFQQIWRSRRRNKEESHDKKLHDMCHFYDVVRIDAEMEEEEVMSLEDQRILASYLPLLREFIPSAAAQVESDVHDYMSKQDDYVYDYYTVRDDMDIDDKDSLSPFPLVRVEDEEFYDGPDDESDYDSDDSNAEDHPRNDYPDETSLEEDEDEEKSEASTAESEEHGDSTTGSSEFEELRRRLSKDAVIFEDGNYDDDDAFDYEGDDVKSNYDDEDWR
ncbi:RNA-directed DNA methylation 4 isoform X2 [Jatropha curcas]|uniref:RNA-directed DNA methylation 4 isoform X2 n=1 Tax=Jatropha curcas TaxID=180498 RepID=UPI0018952474|nr:RNA-directed DNA methylation 4 isoform X2 [Jatropha curcas]